MFQANVFSSFWVMLNFNVNVSPMHMTANTTNPLKSLAIAKKSGWYSYYLDLVDSILYSVFKYLRCTETTKTRKIELSADHQLKQ